MSRLRFLPFLLIGTAAAQQTPPVQQLPPDEDPAPAKTQPKPPVKPDVKPDAKASADTDLPPDEDVTAVKTEYSFNPVKSKKSLEIGTEYFKKGNYSAAAERFRDATGWNDSNADAWLRLGESEEKRGRAKAARSAYEKYLQLAANTKNAAEVKKKLEKLKQE